MTQRTAEIAGAGFGGMATAVALARRGWRVRVHERADQLRTAGAGIYVYENGLRVFEALGIYDDVIARAFRGRIRELRNEKNAVVSRIEWPDDGPMRMYSIVRQDIIDALARAAEREGVVIETGSQVTGASADGTLTLDGGKSVKADLVIGADGVNSSVRDSLGLMKHNIRLKESCIRALIPRTTEEQTGAEGQKYYEYLGGKRRVLYTPCSATDLYLALVMPRTDDTGKKVPVDADSWSRAFPHLESVFRRMDDAGRLDDFGEIKLTRWSAGHVGVLGDAANAMPPNIGQGAGTAMMNGLSLAVYLDKTDDVPAALAQWEQNERPLTEHTQRISRFYAIPTQWPFWIRHPTMQAVHAVPWLNKQRIRTASHIPLGTRPED
jgi:2-polyprenyl-6-methoxyphenol hydroxylase-like FAD-dependent oxidoreductase